MSESPGVIAKGHDPGVSSLFLQWQKSRSQIFPVIECCHVLSASPPRP